MDVMNQGKNRKISIGRIQIWARFGVQRLTLRHDFPTQRTETKMFLQKQKRKAAHFIQQKIPLGSEMYIGKKNVKGHSTEDIKHSCFPNNLNNGHIYTS